MTDQQNKFKNSLKGPDQGKKKFNFYWIYAILAVVFIALNFYNWGGSGPKEITWNKFETFLRNQQVEKIVVVNKETAEIFIKKEAIESGDTAFKSLIPKKGIGAGTNKGPHFQFEILSSENFETKVRDVEKSVIAQDTVGKTLQEKQTILSRQGVDIIPDTRKDWLSDILGWILLPVILIVVWLVIMRSMGKGAGGSQIFNVGKSKAQLFDKNTSSSITFNDVAGLEEAKVEIMEIVDFLKDPKKIYNLRR